jgi:hypothetical protein
MTNTAAPIVGVWKLTGFTRKDAATGKTDKPRGERPTGYVVFTQGGHFVAFNVAQNRKAPATSVPKNSECVELFNSMAAFCGTYKMQGKQAVTHIDASWIQSWTGTDRPLDIEITGRKLTMTSAPFKSPVDGKDVVVITTYDRAE